MLEHSKEPSSVVFVVGNSRSGTTMMGRILGNHELIFTFHEIHFFEESISIKHIVNPVPEKKAHYISANLLSIQREGYLKQRMLKKYHAESRDIIQTINDKSVLTPILVFKKYLNYETIKNGKQIPCDQTPRNLFFLKEILDQFPGAMVINMVRDPRDVLLSQKKKWKRRYLGGRNIPFMESFRSWVNYHPIVISRLWNASVRKTEEFKYEKRVLTIYFEELLSEPDTVIEKVCTFLNIEFDPEMLRIPQIGSSSQKDDFEKFGIRKERASSWRNGGLTATELYFCQKICSEEMNKHGYTYETNRYSLLKVIFTSMIFPFKLCLSFFMNIRRYRNLFDSFRRRFL